MSEPSHVNPLDALVDLAIDLVDLPRPAFKARLKADLLGKLEQPLRRTTPMATTADRATIRQTASPRLRVRNAPAAIDFYVRAFGAREVLRFTVPGGPVAHAELIIGNALVNVAEEAPQYGYPGPEHYGGSPVAMALEVPDVDAAVDRAVAAGARLVSPPADQFYGSRSGTVADPFGYSWSISTVIEELSVDEMYRRFEAVRPQLPKPLAAYARPGFHTVTPYLIAANAPAVIDFVKTSFGAEETTRAIGSAGGVHAEVRIGDSMLMIGGGAPDLSWRGSSRPTALHLYVPDVDEAYRRALDAGGTSIGEPAEMEYGERSGGVKDQAGNVWYIATAHGAHHVPEGLHTVNVYLHPPRAEPVIAFLKRAFDVGNVEKYASPDGVVHHARVTIGSSVVEMGEAHGPYQPMPTTFFVYVQDVDAAHRRALEAGATSTREPALAPFGDRLATVRDPFGNEWHLVSGVAQ